MATSDLSCRPDAVTRRVGILFVASRLFSEEAAQQTMNHTKMLGANDRLDGVLDIASVLVRDSKSCSEALRLFEPSRLAGLVVQLSTFCPAELLDDILAFADHHRLPIALWGLEETHAIVTNSLCGLQLWASTLQRFDHRFGILLGNPDSSEIIDQLAAFAAAARAATSIVGSRIALIGTHAPWFTNLAADPWILKRLFGVSVSQMSLPRFLETCEADEQDVIASAKLWAQAAFEDGDADRSRETLGRTYARLKAGLDRIDADAIAIRDWPEILYSDAFVGTWPALGELSDRPVPIAPEGDVMGALTALAARAFSPGSLPFLTDISGIDRTRNRLILWHYGVSPRLAAGPRSLDRDLKQESFPLRAGKLTLLRLSLRSDHTARLFVSEGEIEAEHPEANRAAGYFRPSNSDAGSFLGAFIEHGYEHHVTGLYGDWAQAAYELGRQLGLQVDHV